MNDKKHCSGCDRDLPSSGPSSAFGTNSAKADGLQTTCRRCRSKSRKAARRGEPSEADKEAAKVLAAAEARARRMASDIAPLTPDDLFDVSVGNVDTAASRRLSGQASREKRQEFNERMGEHALDVESAARAAPGRGGDVLAGMTARSGAYIGALAEQEARFHRRRMARTVSLSNANEAMNLAAMKQIAAECFAKKIVATGYAARPPHAAPIKRSVVLHLSDLHLGADLSALDEPMPFRAVEEARRLEYVMRQAIDYKPQYRTNSELVLCLNGDLIEGQLGHQIGAGAPLAEQKAIFWQHSFRMLGEFARAFPRVRVFCQSGNHGRDKVRHPGRATWRKWDGHEFEMYYALRMAASGLKNVSFDIPFRAVSSIDLHGQHIGMTHGDTDVGIGHPDTKAKQNAQALDKINATRLWGHEYAGWLFGHYHTGRYVLGSPRLIFNAALVPPNGHARSSAWINDVCGQFLFEAVEGHPIGDVRFLEVNASTDADERLGTILKPYRFEMEV